MSTYFLCLDSGYEVGPLVSKEVWRKVCGGSRISADSKLGTCRTTTANECKHIRTSRSPLFIALT